MKFLKCYLLKEGERILYIQGVLSRSPSSLKIFQNSDMTLGTQKTHTLAHVNPVVGAITCVIYWGISNTRQSLPWPMFLRLVRGLLLISNKDKGLDLGSQLGQLHTPPLPPGYIRRYLDTFLAATTMRWPGMMPSVSKVQDSLHPTAQRESMRPQMPTTARQRDPSTDMGSFTVLLGLGFCKKNLGRSSRQS